MLSDEQINAVTLAQWGEANGAMMAAHRAYARAIEAEVRKQDTALIRQLVEALEHHIFLTRPITDSQEALTAARARLEDAK